MLLNGKNIIVTGGAQGIGASAVRAFAKEGANVASLDILDEFGHVLAEEVTQIGPGSVHFYHCDVSNRIEVEKSFERVFQHFGGLDVLVNCAGVQRRGPAEDLLEQDIELTFKVNVYGTIYTNQAAFRYMRRQGGRIFNIASAAGMNPFPGAAHYSASKGAVASWTRSVAHEWGKYNITVNSLAPALWTPMYSEKRSKMSRSELEVHDEVYAKQIPIGGKLGDPDTDFAPVLVFLAGEGSRFITGQIIAVDGGLISTR